MSTYPSTTLFSCSWHNRKKKNHIAVSNELHNFYIVHTNSHQKLERGWKLHKISYTDLFRNVCSETFQWYCLSLYASCVCSGQNPKGWLFWKWNLHLLVRERSWGGGYFSIGERKVKRVEWKPLSHMTIALLIFWYKIMLSFESVGKHDL